MGKNIINAKLREKFMNALEDAGATPDLIEKIFLSKDNTVISKMLKTATVHFRKNEVDKRFGKLVVESEITIPEDYIPLGYMDKFKEEHEKDFSFFDGSITDKGYGMPMFVLKKGETYTVKVIPIKGKAIPIKALCFFSSPSTPVDGLFISRSLKNPLTARFFIYLCFQSKHAERYFFPTGKSTRMKK